MTILKIQTGENNPLLRQKANQVKEITPAIKQLVLDMIETMKAGDGIGLAAPQVGQLLRIIIVRPDPDKKILALINPEIKKTSFRKEIIEEGCLSLPDLSLPIKRPIKIVVQGLNLEGERVRIKAKELLARVIQHEIEHLDGILITDKNERKKS